MEFMLIIFNKSTVLFVVICAADIILGICIIRLLYIPSSGRVTEALGSRSTGLSLYFRCRRLAAAGMSAWGRRFEKGSIYIRARSRVKKAGYKGEYAALVYLGVRFAATPIVFILTFIINYPDVIRPVASAMLINSSMELLLASKRRSFNMRFQKHIYKIYKYLYNQISSGVKPTDAVCSVYEVVEDYELKAILIRLAARYELTLDIDSALEEFRSNFDAHEADTLCLALKQGIETGDNKELLARQEDMMFKKYFNYVQAETDSCRNRSVAAVAVFVAVISVMIIVPMINDVSEAIGKIFIN